MDTLGKVARLESNQVARFCRENHIRRLALFGSILRDDFNPASDVDILAEFEPGVRIGLIRMAGIELELSDLIGRRVDLRTQAELSRYFRRDVLERAEVLYDAS